MNSAETNAPLHTGDTLTVHLTNGNGFTWNETITGVVTVYPAAASYSAVTVGIVTQNADGFTAPVGFSGIPGGMNPLVTPGLSTDFGTYPTMPMEMPWGDVVVVRDLTVTGNAHKIAFELVVPRQLLLDDLCFVSAHAAATNGADGDQTAAAPFVLLPPHTVQAVQNALKTFGDFAAVAVTERPSEAGGTHEYTLDYRAPDELLDRLDGVRFELAETGDTLSGTVVINPQEHTLTDYLRAFIHADRVRIPVAFPLAPLDAAGKAGEPAAFVVARLHQLLDPFLNPVAG